MTRIDDLQPRLDVAARVGTPWVAVACDDLAVLLAVVRVLEKIADPNLFDTQSDAEIALLYRDWAKQALAALNREPA